MQYFKVNNNADNTFKNVNKTDILVKNELYTKKELSKFAPINSIYVQKYFTAINIPKNDTFYFFGARFCKQYPYNS